MKQFNGIVYKIGEVRYNVVRKHVSTKTVPDILAEMLTNKLKNN